MRISGVKLFSVIFSSCCRLLISMVQILLYIDECLYMAAREAMSMMMKDDLQVGSGLLAVKPEALTQRIHTPPQVDISASKNRKIGNRRGISVLFISSENAHISPSQQKTAIDSSFLSPRHKCLIDIILPSTIHL